MEDRKIPFYKRVKLAIFNIEKYQEFALEKTKVAIKYFLKLILFFTAIICVAFTYKYITIAKSAIEILRNDIPDFIFENNELTSNAEEPTILNAGDNDLNYLIIFDTNITEDSQEFDEYLMKAKLYNLGMIFLKDKVILSSNITNNLQRISYESIFNEDKFDKQGLLDKINSIDMTSACFKLYLTLVICGFISYAISTLLETILLFILGYLTTKIARINLMNNQIYIIGIYSLTLSILLNAIYIPINILTGFEIEYFRMMYTAVSYIYLITAILMIRTDIIKQQDEIKKLEDVQEEIRQEIKLKKEEEKESDDNKKKKEENKDLGNDEEAPEGT